ncbi:hypothetical protein FGG08_003845 [Glutinoglossum americanum]|uniref:F-box domain-containing protein n=1 Tax=Glutinoglossum americanum TaxID=1670608 RepID=A0A9P8I8R1_9PEZI|nr:hypothetical protein FGG08_003845 [Glutinoglossum americanum]
MSGKAKNVVSAPPPAPHAPVSRSGDPFQVLDDMCIRTIFMFLSPVDVVRCEAVSRHWKATAGFHMTGYLIRRDFPYAWESERFAGLADDERMTEFKRLAFENEAIRLGKATWAYQYTDAQICSVAGDYVVWHKQGESYIQWQVLTGAGETGRQVGGTRVFKVSELVQTSGSVKIESLHVNNLGILNVFMWVRKNMYLTGSGRDYEDLARQNVVVSLQENKVLWGDTSTLLPHQWKPLTISTNTMYYLAYTKSRDPATRRARRNLQPPRRTTTSLTACDLRTGKTLYCNHLCDVSPDQVGIANFKILHLQGKEYIIQLGSGRAYVYVVMGTNPTEELAIIDAGVGKVIQNFKYGGLRAQDVFLKPNSGTFALWTPPEVYSELAGGIGLQNYRSNNSGRSPYFGLIHTFALNPDGKTFALQNVSSVRVPGASLPNSVHAVHPFTHLGFQVDAQGLSSVVLKKYYDDRDLENFNDTDDVDGCKGFFNLGHGQKLYINTRYDGCNQTAVTLPQREGEGDGAAGGRRDFSVSYQPASPADGLDMLDGTRVMFTARRSGVEMAYIISFGTVW